MSQGLFEVIANVAHTFEFLMCLEISKSASNLCENECCTVRELSLPAYGNVFLGIRGRSGATSSLLIDTKMDTGSEVTSLKYKHKLFHKNINLMCNRSLDRPFL